MSSHTLVPVPCQLRSTIPHNDKNKVLLNVTNREEIIVAMVSESMGFLLRIRGSEGKVVDGRKGWGITWKQHAFSCR